MAADEVAEILLDESGESASPKTDYAEPGAKSVKTKSAKRGGRPAGRPAASGAKELANILAKAVGGCSYILALFLVGPDDAGEVAMTNPEALAIANPLSRLLAKTELARRVMDLAEKGGDRLAVALALAQYAMRVVPLVIQRRAELAARERQSSGLRGTVQHTAPLRQQASSGESASGNGSAPFTGGVPIDLFGAGYSDPDASKNGAYGDVNAAFRAATGYAAG